MVTREKDPANYSDQEQGGGPRIGGRSMSLEMPPPKPLSPMEESLLPDGVLFRLYDVYSELYTPRIGSQRKIELRKEEDWLKGLVNDNAQLTLPHDLIDRAKRMQIYR